MWRFQSALGPRRIYSPSSPTVPSWGTIMCFKQYAFFFKVSTSRFIYVLLIWKCLYSQKILSNIHFDINKWETFCYKEKMLAIIVILCVVPLFQPTYMCVRILGTDCSCQEGQLKKKVRTCWSLNVAIEYSNAATHIPDVVSKSVFATSLEG